MIPETPDFMEDIPDITVQDQMIQAIKKADLQGAEQVIGRWTDQYGYEEFFSVIMEPVLIRLGDEWIGQESVTIAQVFIAARVAENVLTRIADRRKAAMGELAHKGPIVFGNIEDDFHSLGRKIVVSFLRVHGWEVIDLGNDVTPKEFVDTALKTGAKVIGVSAMTLTTARNIRGLREEIDSRGLKDILRLGVGGAVFIVNPSLVQEVGGDGTAKNAMEAVLLFDRLLKQAEEGAEQS